MRNVKTVCAGCGSVIAYLQSKCRHAKHLDVCKGCARLGVSVEEEDLCEEQVRLKFEDGSEI